MNLLHTTEELGEDAAQTARDVNITKRNLIEDRRIIKEKQIDMETRLKDISERHDRKTDLIAKLEVKKFIMMCELERLQSGK